jgi:transcriptional regulator with XRE-family HTH domain
LAEKSGVSRTYISEIERGRITNVGIEAIFSLAGALGVTVSYLLGLTDDALGEGAERVVQASDYITFDVDSDADRRTLRALVDDYTALRPEHKRLALSYLRMMRQIEEEERGATAATPPSVTPAPHIVGGQ